MALFDRNNDRGYGNRGGWGDEHLRRDYENRDTMDAGGNYDRGMDAGPRSRGREGLWANSWSDGAWTADAADRTERDWNLGGGGRHGYDRDWRGGGMNRGGMQGGGTGMNRGGMERGHGWNLAGGEWGHNWGSGNLGSGGGYGAGGMNRGGGWDDHGGTSRGGGFMDRAQNAVRRGWDRVEETFDRDDDRHLGGGAMRGGTSWAGNYDRDYGGGMRGDSGVRGYRDDEGHYGVGPAHNDDNVARPGGGMNRYGGDYERGRGWGARGGMNRYGGDYGRGRNWF